MAASSRIPIILAAICLSLVAWRGLYKIVYPDAIDWQCLESSCPSSPRCQQGLCWQRSASDAISGKVLTAHTNGVNPLLHVALDAGIDGDEGRANENVSPHTTKASAAIPNFVFDHAPLVHLHAEEKYWPGDMQEHLDHVTPKLNYTAITAHSPELDSLDSLNEWERGWSVYLTSNDDPEALPPWLGGEENIPNPYTEDEVGLDGQEPISDPINIATHDQQILNIRPAPSITPSEAKHLRPGYSPAPAVLVVIEKPDNITDAFWFFFYSFNLGNTVFNVRFGNHVGDWEHTLIRFKNGKPIEAFLSEHNFGSSYTFNALEKHFERDTGSSDKRKRSRRSSGQEKWKADRPIVYSAIGTHAMYATPGRHTYVLPFGLLHDETSRGPLWDPTLNLLSYTYTLPSLDSPTPVLKPDAKRNPNAPKGWFFYNGHWGDKGYEMEDPRQYEFVGQKHYVSGPIGPRFKALGRKHICPSYEGKCLIRDVRGLEGPRIWEGGDDEWPGR